MNTNDNHPLSNGTYWNDAQREHADYMAGEATELQNALALSRMERKPDDSAKISRLVARGRFVAVMEHPVFCLRTDAAMGSHKTLLGDFATRQEADARLHDERFDDGETAFYVLPIALPPARPPVSLTDEETPF